MGKMKEFCRVSQQVAVFLLKLKPASIYGYTTADGIGPATAFDKCHLRNTFN